MVDNYFKVAVWRRAQVGAERHPIVQDVFPFLSESADDTKRALNAAMAFWCQLPVADVHDAQFSVYRRCGCVMQSGKREFEEIGKFS